MARYFFHLKDGTDTLIDAEGVQLENADAARDAALFQAREIIGHEARNGILDLRQRIEVLDELGKPVCSLDFADAVEIRR